ncbi:hypothetical protein [Paracoccus sp. DMF]|uniref:hypothetical protein n=1 Tax=Paracoccus sp. DMF TaxID=400837 RepID=UPI0011035138|nr:hypothetical protein [Paracoccus sp. DMF]MCV2446554.1 hypothetical protein [Paracoccus sp. DMF]
MSGKTDKPDIPGALIAPLPKDMTNPETLLTTKEATAYLGWSKSRLPGYRQQARENDTPPKVRYLTLPDGRIRYRLGDLWDVKAIENKGTQL